MATALRPVARTDAPTPQNIRRMSASPNNTRRDAVVEAARVLGGLRDVLKARIGKLPQRERLAQKDADGGALRIWFSDESRPPSMAALLRALVKLNDAECWRLFATVMAAEAEAMDEQLSVADALDSEDLAEAHGDIANRKFLTAPTEANRCEARSKTLRQIGAGFRVLHAIEHVRPMGLTHYKETAR